MLAMPTSVRARQADFLAKYRNIYPFKQLATYDKSLPQLVRWARGSQSQRRFAENTQITYGTIRHVEKGLFHPTESIEAIATIIGHSPLQVRNIITIEQMLDHYQALKKQRALPPLSTWKKNLLDKASAIRQTALTWAAKSLDADYFLSSLLAITPTELERYVYTSNSVVYPIPATAKTSPTKRVDTVLKRYQKLLDKESPQAVDTVLTEYLLAKGYTTNIGVLRAHLQAANTIRLKQVQSLSQINNFIKSLEELNIAGSKSAIDRLNSFTKPFIIYLHQAQGNRSRTSIAKLANLDIGSLRQYETKRKFPSPQSLIRLSEVLGLDAQVMLDVVELEKIIKKYDELQLNGQLPRLAPDLHAALQKASALRMHALSQVANDNFNLSRFWKKLAATSLEQLRAFDRTIGSYLWTVMQEEGYDADAIYALSGIDPTQLDAYLRGVKFPTLKSLQKLAEILSLPATTLRDVRAAEMAAASYHFFTEKMHILIKLPDNMHEALQQADTIRLADIFQHQLALQGFSQDDFATFEPFAVHLEDVMVNMEDDPAVKQYRESYSLHNFGGNRLLPSAKQLRKLTSKLAMDYEAMQRVVDIEKLLLTYSKLSKQHHDFNTQLPSSWQEVLQASANRTATTYFVSVLGTELKRKRTVLQYTIDALATAMRPYFPTHTSPDFIKKTLLNYEHHQALPPPQIRQGLATVLKFNDAGLATMIAYDQQIIATNILQQKAVRIRLSLDDINSYRSVATHLQAALKAAGLTTMQLAARLAKFQDNKPPKYIPTLSKRLHLYLRGEILPHRSRLEHLHQILDFDLDQLLRTTKIEKYLRDYRKLQQEHGELPLPHQRALDHAVARLVATKAWK